MQETFDEFNAELIRRISTCESISRRTVVQAANELLKERQEAVLVWVLQEKQD